MTIQARPEHWDYIATIDLGSNSFHMLIAVEGEEGGIRVVDRVREMIRLGAGLQDDRTLSEKSQQRALECLKRFRERLSAIPSHRVSVVGTNTLRVARNSREFLARAEEVLGYPISIISGHEEARMVYLGAAFGLAVSNQKRLVIDIGGGSTEIIAGQGYRPLQLDSLYIGCVSLTRRFFHDSRITEKRMNTASQYVRRELETIVNKYRQIGWDEVVGTSGTIRAIDKLSRSLGIKKDWISQDGIDAIRSWMLENQSSENLLLVSEQRRPVFIGGFIILSELLNEFGMDRIDVSDGALREGVAYDLIDRLHDEDARFSAVRELAKFFGSDVSQAERVGKLSGLLLDQVQKNWDLKEDIDHKLLFWAAQLHEIGIGISYSHHHVHGAYIIENSDLDGFSRQAQRMLALIVGNSRQKPRFNDIEWLGPQNSLKIKRLTVILRLAITFYRGRSDITLDEAKLQAFGNSLILILSSKWSHSHPLTVFDLQTEKDYLANAGFNITFEYR
ncbi:MAG: Ppx/GppA phosphatase family protein [Gammaproteobacteria bacterium]|nr:Ppx/GppA phosphatase family protein [Gammaproteobacteria bacterium]MCY4275067.1 Ppx/GppA phosphatase family protein [Gammaproteobacteria bacterium]